MNSIRLKIPGKNAFDLSHDVKLSFNQGELIPVMCIECVPGDNFKKISCQNMVRFQALTAPMMHRNDVMTDTFFVPFRLLWQNWGDYFTNTGVDGILPVYPTVDIDENNYTRLADYLGIPIPIPGAAAEKVSAMPFAAVQMIWNEYFRDQNLQQPVTFELVDGDNTSSFSGNIADIGNLRTRAWEHDYFTASLPFAQKGTAVGLPLGGLDADAPLRRNDTGADTSWTTVLGTSPAQVNEEVTATPGIDNNEFYAKTTGIDIAPTTINDLRRAEAIQQWLEKNARGGTRPTEMIYAHYGVKSPDARLQRPEYVCGTKTPVVVSEVLNTTGTDDLPQGNMAGHGISVTQGAYGRYNCQEHGFLITLMSCRPRTAYQQGLNKMWLKYNDPTEIMFPSFAHLGEQPVLNKEVYAYQGDVGNNTFGYMPRYGEFRYEPSRVAGDFRTTLNFWHQGRIFATPPALNSTFISCVPDDRVFAVTDQDTQKLLAHVYHKILAIRPLPKYGTPSM